MGDQAVPAGQSVLSLKGGIQMLRLQSPLPERYTHATADELAAMIGAAKAELGHGSSSWATTTSATT